VGAVVATGVARKGWAEPYETARAATRDRKATCHGRTDDVTESALVNTYAQFPMTIASGSGARVRDDRGREYWDLYGGHAVALIGHSHPAVTRALAEQAERLTFYSNAAPLEIRARAAERLCQFAPDGLGRVFFCNSGSEANENALKLAIQQTGRKRIAALEGGFHGRTLLAVAATANDRLRAPYDGLLCSTVRLQPNRVSDVDRIADGGVLEGAATAVR
jgi:acetylornithine/N-succinyldiaminopimelate aminotransferase